MTKTISANLQTHIDGASTTMARLLKLTRVDGTEFFFTSHDESIVYDGDTYVALGGFNATSIESATGMAVDNLDLETAIESAGITEVDIIAGLFDFAGFEIFDLNYESVADGIIYQRVGKIGQYRHEAPQANIELRGLIQYLQQRILRLMMKSCDADLGDARCGISLAAHTVTGTVLSVTNRQVFQVTSVPAAAEGLFTFTSGDNNGLSMEIRSISGSPLDTIHLALPMPFDVAVSDGYSAYRGCDKRASTCEDDFNNIVNFRGYPFLPGNDEIYRYPDAR